MLSAWRARDGHAVRPEQLAAGAYMLSEEVGLSGGPGFPRENRACPAVGDDPTQPLADSRAQADGLALRAPQLHAVGCHVLPEDARPGRSLSRVLPHDECPAAPIRRHRRVDLLRKLIARITRRGTREDTPRTP